MLNMRWLRNLMRRRMNPLDETVAEKWQRRLTYLYVFTAWNAMALLGYYYVKEKKESSVSAAESEAIQTAKLLKLRNAEIYRFSGGTYLGNVHIRDGEVVKPETTTGSELD